MSSEFLPRLIRLQQAGIFPFQRVITFDDFGGIEKAMRDVEGGSTVKAALRIPGDARAVASLPYS